MAAREITQKTRSALFAVAIALFFATAMSCLTGISLLFPNPVLSRIWELNPPAYVAFAPWGKLVGGLLLALAVFCAAAALGLLQRKRWAWWRPSFSLTRRVADSSIWLECREGRRRRSRRFALSFLSDDPRNQAALRRAQRRTLKPAGKLVARYSSLQLIMIAGRNDRATDRRVSPGRAWRLGRRTRLRAWPARPASSAMGAAALGRYRGRTPGPPGQAAALRSLRRRRKMTNAEIRRVQLVLANLRDRR